MEEKLIKELKKLIAKWNELGNKYIVMAKEQITTGEKNQFSEKANGYYKCGEQLRATLIKCGIDLK